MLYFFLGIYKNKCFLQYMRIRGALFKGMKIQKTHVAALLRH